MICGDDDDIIWVSQRSKQTS